MFTVLLVDDEETVLETLTNKLPWQEMGVDTILTAPNGLKALDIAAKHSLALVIADIRMPGMDGLTMVREMRNRSPQTHYILLTAYSEFEYARAAIALGVENYLLKPLVLEEIEQTVRRAITNIYAKRSGDWLTYSNSVLRWLTGSIETDELAERAIHHHINLYLPQYAAICLSKIQPVSLTDFCTRCMTRLSSHYDVYYCQDESGRHFMVIGGRSIVQEDLARQMEEFLKNEQLEDKVAIAVGCIVHEAFDLVQSYVSACRTADANATFNNTKSVQETISADDEADLQIILYESNEQKASELTEQYVARHAAGNHTELITCLKICTRLLLTEYPNASERLRTSLHTFKAQLENILLHQGFSAALTALLHRVRKEFENESLHLNPSVRLALHYIRTEYAQSISIRDFCNRCRMNPAYLGYLFKQECGVFFNEYLLQIRILHATILLRDPQMKVNDITMQTGFSSSSYFIKCFKAAKGLSPARYRMEHCQVSPVVKEDHFD